MQQLDAHVHVTVLLDPQSFVGVEHMPLIGARVQVRQHLAAAHTHSLSRTTCGHDAGWKPCVFTRAMVTRSSPKPRHAECETCPAAVLIANACPNLSW